MRSGPVEAFYGILIIVGLIVCACVLPIRYLWPNAEGLPFWLFVASMPALFVLAWCSLFLVAWLFNGRGKNDALELPLNHRLISAVFVFWLCTFFTALNLEGDLANRAAERRIWQCDKPVSLTTRFASSHIEYSVTSHIPNKSRQDGPYNLLIDFNDKSNNNIGTFGIRHERLSLTSECAGKLHFPRRVQLDGTKIVVTLVPKWAVTQCSDGWFSRSSGKGTCSHHGGVRRNLSEYFR